MRNTDQPQMAQYNWRTSGAVSIMTKEKTNMNNTKNKTHAHKIITYKKFYGRWSRNEYVEFMTISEFQESGIIENTTRVNKHIENGGKLTPDFMTTLITSGNDPHFPEVRTNGGPKLFTEEEYNEAKAVVNSYEANMGSVIDIDGLLTTTEAEFDRAMIYESTSKAKKIMSAYEQQLETEKLLDKMMPNWRK